MSGHGVFAVSRAIFDHTVFADEAYSEREAWIWMIGEASWKARTIRLGAAVIDLKRGQLAVSTRFAASKWKWSEARVRRFFKRLISARMIVSESDAHATRLTICNYDEYQKVSLPTDAPETQERRTYDAPPTQQRRKEEDREIREDRKETGSTEPVTRAQQERGDFPSFWLRYPAKVGRGAAERAYDKAIKAGATHAELMAGLATYIANKPPDREWCHASTWLNQQRWLDEWPSTPSQPRSRHERRDDSDRPSRVGTLLAGLADAAGLDARGHRRDEPHAAWDGPVFDAEAGARGGGFELRSLPLAGGSSGSGADRGATVHGFPGRAAFAR